MKNRILALSIAMLTVFGVCTQAFAAAELPWTKEWALTLSIKSTGKTAGQMVFQPGYLMKAVVTSNTFKEFNDLITKMTGKPSIITPEFVNYYMGYEAIAGALYGKSATDFVYDAELEAIKTKSAAGTLVKSDLKNNRWIHMINALDLEEKNCLAISVKNGVVSGCGDIWQDGITDDEVVCHNGYNYLKCHVECMNTIYNREAQVQPGFCPEN